MRCAPTSGSRNGSRIACVELRQRVQNGSPKFSHDRVYLLVHCKPPIGQEVSEGSENTWMVSMKVHRSPAPEARRSEHLYGDPPSLTRLDQDGNLVSTLSFLDYLATLSSWMGVGSSRILPGGTPQPIFD